MPTNTPDVDPSRGLVVLPAQLVDASGLIVQGCAALDVTTSSQFTLTGRGGLPPNPGEPQSPGAVWENTRLPVTNALQHPSNTVTATPPSPPSATPIVPAQGWVFNNLDLVTLTALAPNAPVSIRSN